MTAVVQRAEQAGKQVKPLILPTNNPLYAVLRTARDLNVQELVVGASNKYGADEQLDQMALYWMTLHEGRLVPLTIRILGRDRDVSFDLGGGNRIPKAAERRARTVAELREAGVGVDRVLLAHDGSRAGSDLFQAVLTLLDPKVALGLAALSPPNGAAALVPADVERAKHLEREVQVHALADGKPVDALIDLVRREKYDVLIVLAAPEPDGDGVPLNTALLAREAPCRVFLAVPPAIPREPEQ
jgi:hypothetical protein